MKLPEPDHVHRYELVDIGSKKPYWVGRCTWPTCSHYLSKTLIRGKKSVCEMCHEPYVIPTQASKIPVRPLCEKCRKVAPKGQGGAS